MKHHGGMHYKAPSEDDIALFMDAEKPLGVTYEPFAVSVIVIDDLEGNSDGYEQNTGIYDFLCNVSVLGSTSEEWHVEDVHIVYRIGQKPKFIKKWECNC